MVMREVTFSLFICVLVSTNLYGVETSGIDVFIRACQNQGLNGALIQSGYADIEIQEFRRLDMASERMRYEQIIESQKKMFKDDPDTLKNLVTSLEKTRDDVKEEETNYFRDGILFKGNDPGLGCRRVVSDRQNDNGTWEPFSTLIMRGDIQKNNATAITNPHNREIRVSTSNYHVLPFQKYGRIQGIFSKTATLSMLDSNNLDRFIFLPHKVEEFKKTMDQLSRQFGVSILQISGKTPYDEGASNAVVLESKNAMGIVYMRYWIDPSRGYICPLAQQYSPENGKIIQEYSAKNYFLHERSGLWYPQECEEKTWDVQNNILLESRQYKINPATFQINQPVSDDEFSIDIAENMVVVDERENPNAVYVATKNGALSLAKGGLDLDKMPWLAKDEKFEFVPHPSTRNTTRYVLASVGILLLFYLLFRMWRNRGAKSI